MAEFCRDCFIEMIWRPTEEELKSIVMSGEDELDFCEGCGKFGRFVIGFGCDRENDSAASLPPPAMTPDYPPPF